MMEQTVPLFLEAQRQTDLKEYFVEERVTYKGNRYFILIDPNDVQQQPLPKEATDN